MDCVLIVISASIGKNRLDGIKQNLKTKHEVDMKLFVDQDGSLSTEEVQEIIGTETEVIDITCMPNR